MTLVLTVEGPGLVSLREAAEALGSEKRARIAFRRALNEAGRDTRAPTYRALAKQTGLKISTTRRALRVKKASADTLAYELRGRGGYINLQHFKARETRAGVSAAPMGKRQVFTSTFIKGAWFPKRKTLRIAGAGAVFQPMTRQLYRNAAGGLALGMRRTGGWGRGFSGAKSTVAIPQQMVQAITAEAFDRIGMARLRRAVTRHIGLITDGILS